MKNPVPEVDIRVELRVHIARQYKTQAKAAAAWGCKPAFVCAVLAGRSNPTKTMLDDAGFERVKSPDKYVRKQKGVA